MFVVSLTLFSISLLYLPILYSIVSQRAEQNTRENEEQSGYLLKTQFAKFAEEMLFGLSSPLLTVLPSAGSLAEEDVKMASCADEIYLFIFTQWSCNLKTLSSNGWNRESQNDIHQLHHYLKL